MTKPKPNFKIGNTARTLNWTQGAGTYGIPTDSLVTVVEVSLEKYGRGRSDWASPRYAVTWNGGPRLWVYEMDLAVSCRCGHPKHSAQCPNVGGCWCDTFTSVR